MKHAKDVAADAANDRSESLHLRASEAERMLDGLGRVAKLQRRVEAVSHHGSDCPIDCNGEGYCRGVTLTRFRVYPRSDAAPFDIAVLRGDEPETKTLRVIIPIGAEPFGYGGGFWERVWV